MKDKTIYTVKGYKGAHMLIDMRDTDSGTICEVMLIGALTSFSTQMTDLTPYQLADALTEGDPITLLAQEAATIFNAEPMRVQKAANLSRDPYAVQNARFDFLGNPIKPTLKNLIVKGSAGWYNVSLKACTCPDHSKGNTCKHRVAAWMHRELIVRPLAKARRVAPAVVLAELEA